MGVVCGRGLFYGTLKVVDLSPRLYVEGTHVFVIYTDHCLLQLYAAPSATSGHLILALHDKYKHVVAIVSPAYRVIREYTGALVQYEPAVLPSRHDVGPFRERAFY